jgi:hypothetical protein
VIAVCGAERALEKHDILGEQACAHSVHSCAGGAAIIRV